MPALDVECILSNEAFLVVRVPQALAWAAEERYDGGSPVGKRYTVDELFRKVLALTAPSEKEQHGESGRTFAAQAGLVKLEASYQGIKARFYVSTSTHFSTLFEEHCTNTWP
eukprot:6649264-Prymnesium_polylepis.1